jgi:acetyltransferase-like isoleucine patch superfamily enzyme
MNIFKKILRLSNYMFRKTFYKGFNVKGLGLISFSSKIKIKKGNFNAGSRFIMAEDNEIRCYGNLEIGNNFFLNRFSRIISHENISIGNDVTIAQFVSILDHDHEYFIDNNNLKLNGYKTKAITIGSNVWIADKVTILKGVVIGDNVVIGANSLVNKDIPSGTIAVGNPCKVIKSLM